MPERFALLAAAWVGMFAFTAAATPAVAEVDRACEAYKNRFAVVAFAVATESKVPREVSSVNGVFLACGTELIPGMPTYELAGSKSQFVRADLTMPPGVEVGRTEGIDEGSYAGRIYPTVNSFWGMPRFPLWLQYQPAELRVDRGPDTDCPEDAVTCYRVMSTESFRWHAWIWEYELEPGQFALTIGPLYNDVFPLSPAGFTLGSGLVLCGYAGSPGASDCGGPGQPFLHRNGYSNPVPCNQGGGWIYTLSATNREGWATAPESDCVNWYEEEEP